ncbi:MAG: hypothetical protein HDS62_10765 [Bacteroidales bacterium]|nr:hypothetical protein [Bacteroidales bacterium]
MKRVKEIRDILNKRQNICKEAPGWYRWWCETERAERLLSQLPIEDQNMLHHKTFEGKDYVAIYFGISTKGKGLNGRLKWHICQTHRPSTVKSGTLSTFRQTLSALLGLKMIDAENEVNTFMNDYCVLEFENTKDSADAEAKESQELNNNEGYYYPLNIKNAGKTPKNVRKKLMDLRKIAKEF